MKTFAITGVGGYIAPRHLQAIKDTGNRLVAAVDPHDAVGILDRYSQEVAFFAEFERFDRHLEKLRRGPAHDHVDYVSICTPNYLHDAHARLALRVGADAICEKPLVINPWNLDGLQELERETGKRVFTILQLRVHPALLALKESLAVNVATKHNVVLTYCTSRGPWYHYSWKGNPERSGGLSCNIGIHFFDLLLWLFGKVQRSEVHLANNKQVAGFLELERANISWFLSIDAKDLPFELRPGERSTHRSLTIDGREIEFTEGFTDLHTKVYERILSGKGFGIEDARPSIELVHSIRTAPVVRKATEIHPSASRKLAI